MKRRVLLHREILPGITLNLTMPSPRAAIEALVAGAELDGARLSERRTVNLPGISMSVAEMIDALREVAGEEVVSRIRYAVDPRVAAIVASWPARWDTSRAESLGFTGDATFADVIRGYIADEKRH